MNTSWLKKQVMQIENTMASEFEEINSFIFHHPELSEKEYISSEYLVETMKSHGFQVTYPYCDIETAFKAELGDDDGPTIAFLAEYDALPGYGPNGEPGHACGHNWIAATTAGAAIVLSKLKEHFKGKIILIGTPAEETVGNKCEMIQNGAFEGINAVMQMHLDNVTLTQTRALAMDAVEFEFIGHACHAASYPHEGINALDAVIQTYNGINALRQHLKPDVRVHGIITNGGEAPNIVPDYAACRFYVRATERSYLNTITEKVISCAKGAALMTGTKLIFKYFENPFDDLINNPILMQLIRQNMELAGVTNITESVEEFPGSSDIGNVSHHCPTVYVYIDAGAKVSVHEKEFMKFANGPIALAQLHKAINAMAYTAIDIYTTNGLLDEIMESYKADSVANNS